MPHYLKINMLFITLLRSQTWAQCSGWLSFRRKNMTELRKQSIKDMIERHESLRDDYIEDKNSLGAGIIQERIDALNDKLKNI